jgi:hypothetical protein
MTSFTKSYFFSTVLCHFYKFLQVCYTFFNFTLSAKQINIYGLGGYGV